MIHETTQNTLWYKYVHCLVSDSVVSRTKTERQGLQNLFRPG
jgi:hypothetical protein